MLGREALVRQIEEHLDRAKPENVSVVGPTMYGKSVLLREVARRYAAGRSGYATAVYVNMRHGTPKTDDEARVKFSGELYEALRESRPEVAELLHFDDVPIKERLQLITQELESRGDRYLVVLDGFDSLLANPGITRDVWDNMYAVARRPVLSLVTGSRRPLRELCRSEESRSSDFWEVFYDVPVLVGRFENEDWEGLLQPAVDSLAVAPEEARGGLSDLIARFYLGDRFVAAEVLVPVEVAERELLEDWLSDKRGGVVAVRVPQRSLDRAHEEQ